MRKKYLSALLFGALLLASAGTFTSCKDYDDDIKNLQEQINTVKTSLDELTTKVNNLGAGIKDFKYENGQLVIVTDKDTNFTVDLPACEGITNLEIKDGVLYADGKAVGNVSGDGGSVVKVEDGVIYIDGEAVAEVGNKVAIVDNGNGTYTLTVDGKEYVLPKSVAADVTVAVVDGNYVFSAYGTTRDEREGISWGTAAKDVDWKGPKGAVKAGQFLVGQISNPVVKVTPATTALDGMTLKLIDSNGNYAPVVVSAIASNDEDAIYSNTRAVSADGQWKLAIAMDETVTEENAATVFAGVNSNDNAVNKKYALIADGRLLSGYEFVIDTDEEATEKTETSLKTVGLDAITANRETLPATLDMGVSYELAYNVPDVYDYYFTISDKDENDAYQKVTLENNVLKGNSSAANLEIALDLTVIGVDGATYTYKEAKTVKFNSTVVDAEELPASPYVVNVDENAEKAVVINLGNTFSDLTPAEAVSLVKGKCVWSIIDNEEDTYLTTNANFNYYLSGAGVAIKFYSDEACENEVKFDDGEANIRNIKFARYTFKEYNPKAKPGTYKLQLVLKAAGATQDTYDEVKKVIAPVTVSVPAFDEIFTKSAAWNEAGVAQLRLTYAGVANAMTLYSTVKGFDVTDASIAYDAVDNVAIINDVKAGSLDGKVVTLNSEVTEKIVSDDHKLKSTKAEITYNVAGVKGFAVKSGKFDVNFLTILDGAKIVNLNGKGAETDFVVNGKGTTFDKATGTPLANGISLVTKDAAFSGIAGFEIEGDDKLDGQYYIGTFSENAGDAATASVAEGKLTVSNLAANTYDAQLTLTYKYGIKSSVVKGKEVHVSMPAITLKVNN